MDTEKKKILARLRTAQGHLGSIIEMIESDEHCIDVLQQTSAVRSAIAKAENALFERHLDRCVSSAVTSKDAKVRESALREVISAFERRS